VSAESLVQAKAMLSLSAPHWKQFGNVPERAYALLGQGRCKVALGEPGPGSALAEAPEPFASTSYRPALTETEAGRSRRGTIVGATRGNTAHRDRPSCRLLVAGSRLPVCAALLGSVFVDPSADELCVDTFGDRRAVGNR
jgi:hypothetical protein